MSPAPRLTKGGMCNHYSSPSLSWAALKKKFFFKYLPKWEPHKHFFDSDFVITETLLDHICLNDGQTRFFFLCFVFFAKVKEEASVLVRDRTRESPSGGKRELMSELKRTRWSDPL